MPAERPRQLLVVCCGLDAGSADVVEALAKFPARPGVLVRCYRAAPAPALEEPASWEAYDASGWSALKGHPQRLAGVASHALRGLHDGNRPVAELVLVAAPAEGEPLRDLDGLLAGFRKRHRLVARVTLAVLAGMEPATQTGRGRLARLPPYARAAEDAIDRVVLLDELDLRGLPVPLRGDGPAAARTAQLIAESVFGELAQPLLRAEEAHRGALGPVGRFLSVGFASWELDGAGARRPVAEYLARQMGEVMAKDGEAAKVPEQEAEVEPWWHDYAAGVLGLTGDARPGSTPGRPPPPPGVSRTDAWLSEIEEAQLGRLRQRFEGSGWSLRTLEREVEARRRALAGLPDLAARTLFTFTQGFAVDYAEYMTGPRVIIDKVVREEKRLNAERVLLCIAAVIAFLVGGYGVFTVGQTAQELGLLAVSLGGAGTAGFIALVKGFHDTYQTVEQVPRTVPDPSEKLKRLRDANRAANLLAQRSERQAERLKGKLGALAPPAASEPGSPLPPELSQVLLEARGIHPPHEAARFWSNLDDPVGFAVADSALSDAVRSHAEEACEGFGELAWGYVTELLATRPATGLELLGEPLQRLPEVAAPRIGMEGLVSGALALLPPELSPAAREYISRQLQRPSLVESDQPGKVAVLCYTQGYSFASDDTPASEQP